MAIDVVAADVSGFREELGKYPDRQVVVDFWAAWCGPCRAIAPVLEEIDREEENVVVLKVDVDDNSALASELGIQSIPTLMFFKDGVANAEPVVGVATKETIKNKFNK